MSGFFGTPTRGGKLTIVNCALWVIVAVGWATDLPLLMLPGLIACWPLAWLFIPLVQGRLNGGPPQELHELAIGCVMIGVNSFLWGYSISWLLSLAEERRKRNEFARRGFAVVISTPAESPTAASNDAPSTPAMTELKGSRGCSTLSTSQMTHGV